jgi:uncharacterized protein
VVEKFNHLVALCNQTLVESADKLLEVIHVSTHVQTTIGKFVWHENYSNDVEAAKRFYAEVFGWDYEVWKPGEADYAMVKVNDQMHAGFLGVQGGAPPHWLGIVQVESSDETAERVESAGGRIIAGPMDLPDVGRLLVLADPQGAVVAAMSPEADAQEMPPSEGVFVWDELATSDVDGAKRFYGEVFGWTSADMDMGPAGTYTMFKRAGDVDVGGAMTLPEGAPHPYWLPYIGTGDVDGCVARATDLGGQALLEPADVPTVGRLAILRDPQGAAFGVFKPTEG